MKNHKRERIFVFIDSQNLNLGTSKDIYNASGKLVYAGWRLDYKKFHIFLANKFRVQKTFLFIGYIKENEALYRKLRSYGYHLIFKETTKDGAGKPKGNVDAELVLHAAAIEFENYDKAIIVSGDGDFCCLLKFLKEKKKLFKLIIPNKRSSSRLLEPFEDCKIFVEYERNKLSREKIKTGGVHSSST